MCSPKACTKRGPAAQMSAPESGKASTLASPYGVLAWMLIFGAGFKFRSLMLERVAGSWVSWGTLRELDC